MLNKIYPYVVTVVFCGFFCACSNHKVTFDFLNPNTNITADDILELNLERIPEDIPMYYKQIGDTTIIFNLDHDEKRILSITWEIKNKNECDSIAFFNSLKEQSLGVFEQMVYKDSNLYYFPLLNHHNNLIFMVSWRRSGDENLFRYEFHFPYR